MSVNCLETALTSSGCVWRRTTSTVPTENFRITKISRPHRLSGLLRGFGSRSLNHTIPASSNTRIHPHANSDCTYPNHQLPCRQLGILNRTNPRKRNRRNRRKHRNRRRCRHNPTKLNQFGSKDNSNNRVRRSIYNSISQNFKCKRRNLFKRTKLGKYLKSDTPGRVRLVTRSF